MKPTDRTALLLSGQMNNVTRHWSGLLFGLVVAMLLSMPADRANDPRHSQRHRD